MPIFSAVSQRIAGDTQDFACLMIFSNDVNSTVRVDIRRLSTQMDMTGTTTSVLIPVYAYRGVGVPNTVGALQTNKTAFDTGAAASSNAVKVWTAVTPDGSNEAGMFGNAGVLAWRQWVGKLRSAAEQQVADDSNQLPLLVKNRDWTLNPGEYMFVRADPIVATDNPQTNGWIVQTVWEETPISTYTISGNVTLSATGVVGAEVTVIVADDTDLTNAFLHSIQTTTTGGAWSAQIPVGKTAYAYASNFNTGTFYTAPGRPFIT